MICVGGPAAGMVVRMSSVGTWKFPEPPSRSDIAYAFHELHVKPLGVRAHEYRPEYIRVRWDDCGEFDAWALVHESVKDADQVRTSVLMAFFGGLMASSIAGALGKERGE